MNTVLVGTVISGTLRNQDLLPAFLDELERVDIDAYQQATFGPFGFIPSYAMEDHSDKWWISEDAMWKLEGLVEALNDAAPEGYYFGAHEGDGADFGWWEIEDE